MTSDDFFKRIETHFNKQLPFVIYRKPHQEKVVHDFKVILTYILPKILQKKALCFHLLMITKKRF